MHRPTNWNALQRIPTYAFATVFCIPTMQSYIPTGVTGICIPGRELQCIPRKNWNTFLDPEPEYIPDKDAHHGKILGMHSDPRIFGLAWNCLLAAHVCRGNKQLLYVRLLSCVWHATLYYSMGVFIFTYFSNIHFHMSIKECIF